MRMDALVDYAAWLLPFLLSIVGIWVAVKVPKARERRAWLIGLCAVFLVTSLLTLYQQHRTRTAHTAEMADLTRAIEKIGNAVHVQSGSGSIVELADQILAKVNPVWNMTEGEIARLATELSRVPQESRFKVRLLLLPASQQSHTYGDYLSGVLHQNGYDGERVTDYTLDSNLSGLSVIVPNGTKNMTDIPEKTRELITILQRARIPFTLRPPGTSTQWDTPAIVVGMKPAT
jgi:hypothetical protein